MTPAEKQAFDAMREALESCKVEAVVNRKLEWFEVKVFNKELVRAALAAADAVAEGDVCTVTVQRSRMVALSKALGHPSQLAVLEGETAGDALLELAATKLQQAERQEDDPR